MVKRIVGLFTFGIVILSALWLLGQQRAAGPEYGCPELLDELDLALHGPLGASAEADALLARYEEQYDNRGWWQRDVPGLSEEDAAKAKQREATSALYTIITSHRETEAALTAKLRIADINRYPPSCRARCRQIAEEIAHDFPDTWQAVLAEWLIGQILRMDAGWGRDPAGSRAAIRYHMDHLERYASLDISKNPHARSMFGQTSPGRARPGSLRAETLNIVAYWSEHDLLDFAEAKRLWTMVVEEYPGSIEASCAVSNLRSLDEPTYRAFLTRQYKAMHPEEAGKTK